MTLKIQHEKEEWNARVTDVRQVARNSLFASRELFYSTICVNLRNGFRDDIPDSLRSMLLALTFPAVLIVIPIEQRFGYFSPSPPPFPPPPRARTGDLV